MAEFRVYQMKVVAFFHRLELSQLFGPVSLNFPRDIGIIHIAYSSDEAKYLADQGIVCDIIFKDEIARRLTTQVAPDADLIKEIDETIRIYSNGAFTLNSAIQSDRSFTILSYEDCLKITVAYWSFWTDFIETFNIDHIVHEPVSLMMNFISAVALAQRGGCYLYCIMTAGIGSEYSFIVMAGIELYAPDLVHALAKPNSVVRSSTYTRADLEVFLARFRKNMANFQGGVIAQSVSLPLLAVKALYLKVRQLVTVSGTIKLVDCVEQWELRQNLPADKIRNLLAYRASVRFDQPQPKEIYWFYPLHLEPEAVVLYQAHGLYTNQIKLIENIAAQLPAGHYLYVKDHPHNLGYRNANDYLRLNAVPNIRLLPVNISGKSVIRNAKGVITITGTAGFEAMLMGKPVVLFGQTFYCQGPGVVHVRNIRELSQAIDQLIGQEPISEEVLIEFLAAYFDSIHPGMTDFFAGQAVRSGVNQVENARIVADGLVRTIRSL